MVHIEGVQPGGRRERDWSKRYPWAKRVEVREDRERDFAPRSEWGPGPWNSEPDLIEWRHESGLPCLMVRGPTGGWCGYVGLPAGHPIFGEHYDKVDEDSSHGGLTFSGTCHGDICHEPEPGEPAEVWWLGFDCCHAFDLAPGMEAIHRRHRQQFPDMFGRTSGELEAHCRDVYRDVDYVRGHVDDLAGELAHGRSDWGRDRWWWALLGGAREFLRRTLPELFREIYLDRDARGRGPREREMMRLCYGERWDRDGLRKMALARKQDRPW